MQLTVSIPYATFIIAAGLQGVPRHIDETAMSLGVGPFRIWFTVTLPCVYPHIIIAGLMIFLMSIGDVGGPLVIGGGFSVLASEIYTNFLSLLNDERIALIFSLWIILLSFLLLGMVNWLLKLTVKQYRPGTNPVIYKLRSMRTPATLFVLIVLALLLLPFLIILVHSTVTIWSFEILPRGWSMDSYRHILTSPGMLVDTIVIVAISAPAIIVIGVILGHTIYVRKRWRFLNFLLIVPFVLPGIVLAVGGFGKLRGAYSAGSFGPLSSVTHFDRYRAKTTVQPQDSRSRISDYRPAARRGCPKSWEQPFPFFPPGFTTANENVRFRCICAGRGKDRNRNFSLVNIGSSGLEIPLIGNYVVY